jgi:hypothetical protein
MYEDIYLWEYNYSGRKLLCIVYIFDSFNNVLLVIELIEISDK